MLQSGVVADQLTISIPADPRYLALLRTGVGGAVAREGLTLDQVEDLKMAVEEAATSLLAARPETVVAVVRLGGDPLEVQVRARLDDDLPIDRGGFSWMILEAMADEVVAERDGDDFVFTMRAALPTPR